MIFLVKALNKSNFEYAGWPSRNPLGIGNRRQFAVGDVIIKIKRVLEMRRADRRLGHDRRLVEERIADVAIEPGVGARNKDVPALAVIFPGDSFFGH
jgi:hypothetical protein